MKSIADILSNELLSQKFSEKHTNISTPDKYLDMASNYATIENAIAVLSDLRSNISHIYYGGSSSLFCLGRDKKECKVSSIWEEEIFRRIHPDDLAEKHLEELHFFHYIKQQPPKKRADYYLMSRLRMRTATNTYIPVMHRMFYISETSDETLCMALCLYSPLTIDLPTKCVIIDSSDGHRIEMEKQGSKKILSEREKQILCFIDKGLTSKDIAEILCISINTVSRHRQDILSKLHAKNSIEACRTAKDLRLI